MSNRLFQGIVHQMKDAIDIGSNARIP